MDFFCWSLFLGKRRYKFLQILLGCVDFG